MKLQTQLFAFLVLQGVCLATSVSVPGDYASIALAVSAAQQNNLITQIVLDSEIHFYESEVNLSGITQDLTLESSDPENPAIWDPGHDSGRAIIAVNVVGHISIDGIQFQNFNSTNSSLYAGDGGVLYFHNTDLTINECIFSHNQTSSRGGAVFIDYAELSSSWNVFEYNSAGSQGGAYYVTELEDCEIAHDNFNNNTSEEEGGAILNAPGITAEITYCNFFQNDSYMGSAIRSADPIFITNCSFKENYTSTGGCTLYIYGSANQIPTPVVTIDDCTFEDNENGGNTVSMSLVNVYIRRTRFAGNVSGYGCIAFGLGSNSFIADCEITDNTTYYSGGIISSCGDDNVVPAIFCTMSIDNCLIYDNNMYHNESSYLDGVITSWLSDLTLKNSTIYHNLFTQNIAGQAAVRLYPGCDVDIENVIIHDNKKMQALKCTTGGFGGSLLVSYTDVYLNETGDWIDDLAPFNGIDGNISIAPEFVNTETNDYRLTWDSPLMDVGDPNESQDFDLTRSDIGWKPRFTPVTLTQNQNDIDVGWYYIPQNSTLTVTYSGEIPSGTIFRILQDASLKVKGPSGTFEVGEAQKARTAFVSVTTVMENHYFASNLTFEGTNTSTIDFNGVLLRSFPDQLAFKDCNIVLDADQMGDYLTFDNSIDNPDFNLNYTDCIGALAGFDFSTGTMLARYISLLRSSINIDNCNFRTPAAVGYSLMVDGHMPEYDMLISNCNFPGNSTSYPSLKMQEADPRLEKNTFDNCRFYAIWSYLGLFGMDHAAKNNLKSELQPAQTNLNYLMYLFNSPAYLECGENNFVYNYVNNNPSFKYVHYRGPEPAVVEGLDIKNYNKNFWGSNCSTPVVTLTGRIPSWANPGTPLTECSDPNDDPLPCDQIIEMEAMLNNGLQAELQGSTAVASAVFADVITTYPGSRASYHAALRLKSIGFIDESGEAITELQDLADEVAAVDSHLGAYLNGAAECVRAWQGDYDSAQENLVTLRNEAATEDEAIVAQKDLLEIETYASSGGLSSIGGGSFTRLMQAQQDLMSFDPENPFRVQPRGVAGTRPTTVRVENVWPNPFNPTTTLRFNLWRESPTVVRVYNMLGELVATPMEKVLSAGAHEVMWNAGQAAAGMYILRVDACGSSIETKVLYLK